MMPSVVIALSCFGLHTWHNTGQRTRAKPLPPENSNVSNDRSLNVSGANVKLAVI